MLFNNARIVIAGASGFIGRYLCAELVRLKCGEVIRLGSSFNLCNEESWYCPEEVDCVVIAAGAMEGSADHLLEVNHLATAKFADYCRIRGARKLVLLSSGAVYGETNLFTSPANPVQPNSSYGHSKLKGEQDVQRIWAGEKCVVLRLYFPFGPNQRLPRLIPRLVQSVSRGEPVFCRNDGGPFISFTHVTDVAEVITADFILGNKDGVHNLASPRVLGIESIAHMVGQAVGRCPMICYKEGSYNSISMPYPDRHHWRKMSVEELL